MSKQGRRGSRPAAFTIVELLVTFSIIGMLAAMLFPVLSRARERARDRVCLSNLHQIGVALSIYAGEWSVYPDADGWGEQNRITKYGQGPAGNGYWSAVPMMLYSNGYLDNPDVFWCPVLSMRYPDRLAYLRYAMDGGAADQGGPYIKPTSPGSFWLAACLYIQVTWDERAFIPYPHTNGAAEGILFNDGHVAMHPAPWYAGFGDPIPRRGR